MKFPELTKEERLAFTNGVIRVSGKSMNRTALGIVAAHVKDYGIVIDKFETRKAFSKGSYNLEILNDELFKKISANQSSAGENAGPQFTGNQKRIPFWLWLMLGLVILIIVLWISGIFRK